MYKLTNDPNTIIRKFDNASIPNGHRFWKEYQDWLSQGNTPEPEFNNSELLENKKIEERSWRDKELVRADNEINKIEDASGSFGALNWRSYRVALRNYTRQSDFPNGTRPTSP